MRDINRIIIHCTDTDTGNVVDIRHFHQQVRGWSDIGYHFLILNGRLTSISPYKSYLDGAVHPGRALPLIGAHTRGHNDDSIGIALVGIAAFTGRQMYQALPALLRRLMTQFGISTRGIYGHRDFAAKACPNIETSLLRWIAGAALAHNPIALSQVTA